MKKLAFILICISSFSFGQSIEITPVSSLNSPASIIKKSGLGFEHSGDNGAVRVGTYASNVDAFIQTHSNHPLKFATNNRFQQLIINTDGKVGIMGGIPDYWLDVRGRARIMHGNGETAGIWYNKSNNEEGAFAGMYNNDIFGLFGMGTVSNWKFGFDMVNNKMGIGMMTPKHPLTFANTVGDKISLWGGSNADTDNHYGIGIQVAALQLYVPDASTNILFGTGRSSAFTERVRITGAGNVGIGTDNPQDKLDVSGNIRSSSLAGANIGYLGSDNNGTIMKMAPVAFSVKNFGGESLTVPGSGFTTIPFGTEEYDYGSFYSTTDNNFTAPRNGIYHFDAVVGWKATTSTTGQYSLYMYLNGSLHTTVREKIFANTQTTMNLSIDIKMNAGQKVHLVVAQNSGADQHILLTAYDTRFSGHFVMPF
ncbi:C1q-like domain-containing protein [Emticicia agri]|uniref:C1q domain-containing protein n=1 Tax=Emticicia agri TaxID=2492393 RepID=A0A4Q5LZF8_9BACT|nr:hypothetical protein [Emticicia agri]RYU95248.1 hypothetical protein EWM59_12395 [Emticicia agri]